MEKELREKFLKIIEATPTDNYSDGATGLNEFISKLMFAAYNLAKQEDAEMIDKIRAVINRESNGTPYNAVGVLCDIYEILNPQMGCRE